MNILGISAFYHDSAAALIVDGDIRAAAQEERFTRVKHDSNFPKNAVDFCLDFSGINYQDINYIVFYDKPVLKFDRLLETYVNFAPSGFHSFSMAIPQWLKKKVNIRREIKKAMPPEFTGKILFLEHHESHAASAFYPSPFAESAILTVDGVGEWATASLGKGDGQNIEMIKEMKFPHSLGLLYSAFTYYTGFKVNSGEYKLMGLAPYGKPKYVQLIKDNFLKIYDDGSLWLDMSYFNYCQGLTMTSKKFNDLFGAPARKSESDITQKEMDIAASIQLITEEVVLKMAEFAKDETGSENLCLAGGVALNCVANGKIIESGIFKNVWVQPAAGDAGGALGAALFCWHKILKNEKITKQMDSQKGSLLGPQYSNDEIQKSLDDNNAVYHLCDNENELLEKASTYLAEEKIIGWFNGRMEFGPRALGGRSIIGDPRSQNMQNMMNLKIKYRESFRPFAPSVLKEDKEQYFSLKEESPYMLIVAPISEKIKKQLTEEEQNILENEENLIERLAVLRSDLPAITHVDFSARVQTVSSERNGRYYKLISAFKEKTDCSVIINTSFNIRGEPIVCTPKDAFRCFMNTDMDVLVIEDFILLKNEQDKTQLTDIESYKHSFKLD